MACLVNHNAQISSIQIDNFPNSLMCPITSALLKDAVILTPCGRTISEIAIQNIYEVENPMVCPLCHHTVEAYYPNLIIRSLVETTLRITPEEAIPTVSTMIKADEKKDLDCILFPGIGAKFVLIDDILS